MTVPFYDLPEAYQRLADLTLESPEPRTGDATAIEEELGALVEEVSDKVLALAKVVVTLESEADLLEQHARLIMGKAQTRRRRVDYLKKWMQLQMEGAGIDGVKDPFVTVWLQASPAAVEVVDEAAVPPEFKRVTLKLPLALVPPDLLGLVQTCDVDRGTIHELIKRTGELPAGIMYRRGANHLRIR